MLPGSHAAALACGAPCGQSLAASSQCCVFFKCASMGCAVPCRAVPCCAVPCCAVLCRAVPCRAVLCRAVPCCAVLCRAVPCCAVLCRAVLCCAVLCRAVPCCAVLCAFRWTRLWAGGLLQSLSSSLRRWPTVTMRTWASTSFVPTTSEQGMHAACAAVAHLWHSYIWLSCSV
jgi:hypothetical protein